MTLIDPNGNFAAYTRPQGDGNHGEVDVAKPVGGTWTAIIFLRDGAFSGKVNWQMLTQDFGSADSLSPASQSIAPGKSKTFQLNVRMPSAAGDSSQDLELNSGAGTTIVPISLRSMVKLNNKGGDFAGNLIGGNGRNGAGQPAQINTFDFNVPAGMPEVSVGLSFQNNPGTQIFASLIGPQRPDGHGRRQHPCRPGHRRRAQFTNALQVYAPSPQAGQWRFVVDVFNPVGGQVLSSPYSGHVSFAAPPVTIDRPAQQREQADRRRQVQDRDGHGQEQRRRRPGPVPGSADAAASGVLVAVDHARHEPGLPDPGRHRSRRCT